LGTAAAAAAAAVSHSPDSQLPVQSYQLQVVVRWCLGFVQRPSPATNGSCARDRLHRMHVVAHAHTALLDAAACSCVMPATRIQQWGAGQQTAAVPLSSIQVEGLTMI
jgi:hypothetical protein